MTRGFVGEYAALRGHGEHEFFGHGDITTPRETLDTPVIEIIDAIAGDAAQSEAFAHPPAMMAVQYDIRAFVYEDGFAQGPVPVQARPEYECAKKDDVLMRAQILRVKEAHVVLRSIHKHPYASSSGDRYFE
jgi:hypothetical protein